MLIKLLLSALLILGRASSLALATTTPIQFCNATTYQFTNCTIDKFERKLYCDVLPTAPEFSEVVGEIEAYVHHDENTHDEVVSYALKEDEMNSIPLLVSKSQPPLVTGEIVKIRARRPGGRSLLSDTFGLEVDEILPSGRDPNTPKDFVVDNKPVNITSITMLASICGRAPRLTYQRLRQRYFNEFALPSEPSTLQMMHSTCTYNKLQFFPENNIIVADIQIPCNGTYRGATYQHTQCNTPELYGWMNFALSEVKLRGINIDKYKRRVLMIPSNPSCPWSGLASVGCTSSCNTWINTGPGNELDTGTLFHELAHNIGLAHSNRNISWMSTEYADCTDPMGCASQTPATMTCSAAPQQYKAGWASPIADIDIATLPIGIPSPYTIPAIALSDKNMIRIRIASLPSYSAFALTPQQHALFVNYRARQNATLFDSALTDDMNQRIYIYTYNTTLLTPPRPDPSIVPFFKPTLLAVLDSRTTRISRMPQLIPTNSIRYWYPEQNAGLHFMFATKNQSAGTFILCKYVTENEGASFDDCVDGIDNDCDGRVDMEEPACRSLFGIEDPIQPPSPNPPPPPSPRPPSPVRRPPRPSPPRRTIKKTKNPAPKTTNQTTTTSSK